MNLSEATTYAETHTHTYVQLVQVQGVYVCVVRLIVYCILFFADGRRNWCCFAFVVLMDSGDCNGDCDVDCRTHPSTGCEHMLYGSAWLCREAWLHHICIGCMEWVKWVGSRWFGAKEANRYGFGTEKWGVGFHFPILAFEIGLYSCLIFACA